VNYKRKSRCRFFLLMQSRTPPTSSEFRGGVWTPQTTTPPTSPLVRRCHASRSYSYHSISLEIHYICWKLKNLLHLIQLLFCHRSTKQFASHIDNATEIPGYGSHIHTIFDTVTTLPLYTVVHAVVCKIKLTLGSYCVGVQWLLTHPVQCSNTLSHKSPLVG